MFLTGAWLVLDCQAVISPVSRLSCLWYAKLQENITYKDVTDEDGTCAVAGPSESASCSSAGGTGLTAC